MSMAHAHTSHAQPARNAPGSAGASPAKPDRSASETIAQAPNNPDHPLASDLLRRAFESLPVALLVFDRRLQVVLRNEAAAALLSDEPDISVALSKLTVEGVFEDWAVELRRVMETRLPRRIDVGVHRQDVSVASPLVGDEGRRATHQKPGEAQKGPETFLNILIHPLRADDGESIGGVLMAEDVTASISMERRLAVSERLAAVGKLAARVAHELNNPLDGILRFTNLAIRRASEHRQDAGATPDKRQQDAGATPDKHRQDAGATPSAGTAVDKKLIGYLEHARSAIVRMSQITGDLLEFSRSTPSTFEQATINKIVEDALFAMEGRAKESRITVVCNLHETDMPVVRGGNLFQVYCNLIKNAIEAMPDGGTLTVSTRVEPPDVIVSIVDTGVGLPEEAERIFEPFFTTKADGHGTGLGLAVCKDLIEKYSGEITPSRNEPHGTIMTVRIPIQSCSAAAVKESRGRGVED